MDRRTFIVASALSATLASTASHARKKPIVPVDMDLTGIDRSRASFLMKNAGFDALVLEQANNVYYATGILPAMTRLGFDGDSFAIIPRDQAAPIQFITPQFAYYFSSADVDMAPGVQAMLVTGPQGDNAADPFFFAHPAGEPLTAKERNRQNETKAAAPYFQSTQHAVKSALEALKIASDNVGYDTIYARNIIEQAQPGAKARDAVDLVKHIRLIKNAREIALMKAASQANIAAALKTASSMRSLGSLRNIRNHFNAEVSRLGNRPGFLVINGSIDEAYDEDIVEGTTVLIDGVSSRAGYYGDYGRTVFVGEPSQTMIHKVKTIGLAWDELRPRLKPGMRFSEIRENGQAILRKMGSDIHVPFNPHTVGLAHTEQPINSLDGTLLDLQLQPGMIISVDCPLMENGSGGTAHLEDLILITEDGSEPIHDVGNQIIIA